MKQGSLATALHNAGKRIPLGLAFALAVLFVQPNASAQEVDLGTATNFAVLAGSAITVAGAANTTTINGNIGSYPTPAITGLGNVVLNGVNETGDAGLMLNAQSDLATAYNTAVGLARTATLTGTDLGNLTLTPGVYFFASSALLTGQLTLNDQGEADAVFVFQIGSTLTTASASSVVTINDPSPGTAGMSVFWQIGSSATLGTGTDFEGNILALTSITDNGGSTVDGRLLAMNGAVSLGDTTINILPGEVSGGSGGGGGGGGGGGAGVPDTGGTILALGVSFAALFAFGRRFSSSA
jgi:hypothetical protein